MSTGAPCVPGARGPFQESVAPGPGPCGACTSAAGFPGWLSRSPARVLTDTVLRGPSVLLGASCRPWGFHFPDSQRSEHSVLPGDGLLGTGSSGTGLLAFSGCFLLVTCLLICGFIRSGKFLSVFFLLR